MGALGTVNAADGPKTFTYTKTVGPTPRLSAVEHKVDNTASFLTNDSGATGSADAGRRRDGDLPAPSARLHAHDRLLEDARRLRPAGRRRDGAAADLAWHRRWGEEHQRPDCGEAVSLLDKEGSNGVADSSNGINKLYAQLLGAKLSGADGADGSVVASVIAAADAFLAGNNSSNWGGLTKAQQATVNGWMTSLDNYNNGLVGVAHCG